MHYLKICAKFRLNIVLFSIYMSRYLDVQDTKIQLNIYPMYHVNPRPTMVNWVIMGWQHVQNVTICTKVPNLEEKGRVLNNFHGRKEGSSEGPTFT